jgi:transposase
MPVLPDAAVLAPMIKADELRFRRAAREAWCQCDRFRTALQSNAVTKSIQTLHAKSRQDAVEAVEQRIDDALAPKKRRLVKPR